MNAPSRGAAVAEPVDLDRATIPSLFFARAQRFADKPFFWAKRGGRYEPASWRSIADSVAQLASYWLRRGVKPGDRVAILSENRPAWGIADLSIQSIGAWTVPIYPSLTSPEIQTILADAEPVAIVVSRPEQAEKIRAIRAQLPSLRTVVVVDPGAQAGEHAWGSALTEGAAAARDTDAERRARLEALRPDATATLIYTSGTTGQPKGVMLSHRNFLSNSAACLKAISVGPDDLHLSFLPLCHVFERMAGWYLMLMAGASIAFAENMDTIPQNMREMSPTIMLGVPRFFEKLQARVQDGLRQAPPLRRTLAYWALSVGKRSAPYRQERQPMPLILRLQYGLADRLVFHTLRERLGGRLRFFVSGGAPLGASIAEFFYSAGIVILEGYGLTETSPVIAVNRPDRLRFGTVGPVMDGIEVRIADDGEILTRGPHIMQGYYRRPDETKQALADGWFHTGDIGHLTDGFLAITDRKKDLIKTAGGKFVAPQKLENLLISDPYISQAFVYGDRERFCVALVVPNVARLLEDGPVPGLSTVSVAELINDPRTHAFIWGRVQALQRELASYEQLKAIALLEHEFSQASGELTPTLKAKRTAIFARYQDVLRRLYDTTSS